MEQISQELETMKTKLKQVVSKLGGESHQSLDSTNQQIDIADQVIQVVNQMLED